jgi:hypothetical protein
LYQHQSSHSVVINKFFFFLFFFYKNRKWFICLFCLLLLLFIYYLIYSNLITFFFDWKSFRVRCPTCDFFLHRSSINYIHILATFSLIYYNFIRFLFSLCIYTCFEKKRRKRIICHSEPWKYKIPTIKNSSCKRTGDTILSKYTYIYI